MTIGELITEYCTEHKIPYQQFAQACDVSKAYISMLVKGKNPKTGKPMKIRIETYDRIAAAMGMTIDTLFNTIDDAPVVISAPEKDEDQELWQLREDMRRRPELRALHNISRKATREQLLQIEAFAMGLTKANEYDENDTP